MEHQESHNTQNSPLAKQSKQSGRVLGGMLIVLIGLALLMRKTDLIEFPYWIFSWKMILIVVGIFIGLKSSFRNNAWFIFVGIGTFFLLDDIMPWFNFRSYFIPIAIIFAGIFVILGAGRRSRRRAYSAKSKQGQFYGESNQYTQKSGQDEGYERQESTYESAQEYIDASTILGEVRKNISSQNFKGGESVTFMGSAEYNLSQAEIQGEINLEILQIFGRTRLIVPAHWEVRSEIVAILGSVDDKSPIGQQQQSNTGKRLVLTGTSVFGSIEIRSY